MLPVVVCCSQRFKNELDGFVLFLKKRGVKVFAPNFRHHRKGFVQKPEHLRLRSAAYKAKVPGMVWAHFHNLENVRSMGGLCLIFNPRFQNGQKKKFGYIGSNTQGEIAFATALKMPVLMLRPHEEEWIMTVTHQPADRDRIFVIKHPKSDPMDFDFMWEHWLKRWLR